ncbi:coiled-coil and C2 domain-containing protein 1B isoform X1 [Physeter macrocephalus]|uniref:Coiled-coil and C2 domain-containing protein 1B n=1 Tax=Physeter macrocephalus TaxID=9755 RepID=A0A2Y9FRM4_PHYMC|nr:coiled-coil and C2 domain-containing protein 1B isoform X1 [Physeter catodon]XP_028342234.1 coiled-coil and C2 domain-containing protein 1B isoform X1 [Physeter catodon]XP_028342235.1 coiled-coil and C2 domain-containing protein 1B isoform X1 [Physeter catodon]XP_028342237.1 coiled-coil and C2 domain-containing protein 1B isoform X1 [Physeter catodon]XP_054939326.1 coiled-coil and C2 domain-containing protein 1B isoform X1 [Physeter catodon]|eukprot:XP_007129285.2 coiled-coil and C2 domain-containing protein 1B isoform X1 [Physeter catodon]
MPGPRPRKGPQASDQGVAAAKQSPQTAKEPLSSWRLALGLGSTLCLVCVSSQLGLFMEFSPEDMLLGMEETEDDGDLEAELLALTGEVGTTGKKPAPKGQAPLPMAHIEKLAADCMRDVEEEEEEGLEEDADLLNELQEVLGADEEAGPLDGDETASPGGSEEKEQENIEPPVQTALLTAPVPAAQAGGPQGLQAVLEDRIHNYREAVASAKETGEAAKARRCERGLKTLESQLAAVRKGRKISEDEIPPPVALGKRPLAPQETTNRSPEAEPPAPHSVEPDNPSQPETSLLGSPSISGPPDSDADPRALLLARQREYKVAALNAKRAGDLDRARELMRIGKRFGAVLEALEKGQPVDLSAMPPAPEDLKPLPQASKASTAPSDVHPAVERVQPVMASDIPATPVAPTEPQTVLDALQQRLNKYREAGAQARGSGDERKARMHERIAKQYQDAIRAHRAGRKVDFAELPVPPGFPPIPGWGPTMGTEEDVVAATLAAAQKLASSEDTAPAEEDEDEDKDEPPAQAPVAKKPAQPLVPSSRPRPEPKASSSKESLSPAVREQVALLQARRLQYQRAALQAKRGQDLEQAKAHLRVAKSLEAQIIQVRAGRPVDLAKVPSPLTDEEGDFILIHHEDLRLSQKAEEVYAQLQKMLLEQHEKCVLFSKQFMHQGNVAETTRFEKLAQDRKKQLEILHLAQAQGLDPPSHHFELKTFQTVRIFAELNSTEMHLIVVRGMNLPAPPGVTPDDLDAFVRFEFHYPNSDQAQKNKTAVVKNTNSPEFDQLFKLNINRNHRGFRRVIQSKGIKFEIFHKGSFFRSDKLVGTAHLKLERLENECEIREIVEVLDGRKPTGGKLEVKVRLREPLSGQDVQMVTENWLVLEPRGL